MMQKGDHWSGYDTENYARDVVARYEARDEARRKFLEQQKLKQVEDKNEDDDDGFKIDESNQMGFEKLHKRVRTTGGGSTGTVRNFRIREDRAKYLNNLNLNSAHYDPKSRSMCDDPIPDIEPNDKIFEGDNKNRISGEALDLNQLLNHVHSASSEAEFLYGNFKVIKEKLKSQTKNAIMEKYENAANEDKLPKELLFGKSETQIEYDRTGRIVKGQENERRKEEKDERKRKYNVTWNDEITAEHMEAYRLKKMNCDVPMKDFMN